MKRLLVVALCAFLVFTPQHQPARAQCGPAVFVVGSLILGGLFIIYVTYKTAPGGNVHRFVLMKSLDHVNWTPVATNTLRMPLDQAMPTFEAYTRDAAAFYRVREIALNQTQLVAPNTKEWAVPQ